VQWMGARRSKNLVSTVHCTYCTQVLSLERENNLLSVSDA
jgi:arginyl-tRNA--protein-N-Asp/Glu arginylyltransferase